MKYKALIFDMDGTILNTLDDLFDTTNFALRKNGLAERAYDEVRMFVGNGIMKLIERAVPENSSQETIEKVYADFMEHYKIHCADKTKAYDGINDLIRRTRELGYKTAVVSNKADGAVQELCREYFDGLFDVSIGEKKGIAKKPAPDTVFEALRILGVENNDAVYIGDSDVDFNTAKNSKMDFIGVSWGFRGRQFLENLGAAVICDKADEILKNI